MGENRFTHKGRMLEKTTERDNASPQQGYTESDIEAGQYNSAEAAQQAAREELSEPAIREVTPKEIEKIKDKEIDKSDLEGVGVRGC